jgi:hypothetical protein
VDGGEVRVRPPMGKMLVIAIGISGRILAIANGGSERILAVAVGDVRNVLIVIPEVDRYGVTILVRLHR